MRGGGVLGVRGDWWCIFVVDVGGTCQVGVEGSGVMFAG